MMDYRHLKDALAELEQAAVDLGRAQAEGRRGTRERQRLSQAYPHLWQDMACLFAARDAELRRAGHVGYRLVAALISL